MENPNDWLDEWLLLWPPEVKSGGETVRSNPKYCVNKFIRFCQQHPNYTKELIFTATKNYLAERKADNWFAVKRAIYFISKLGQESLLEAQCERILQPTPITDVNNIEFNPIDDFI